MIKANNKKIRIMLLIVTLAAIALGAFRAFILANYIEPETGFYYTGTSIGTVFNVLFAVLLVLIGISGAAVRKVKAPEALESESTAVVFSSALCAFMYLSVFLYGVYVIVGGLLSFPSAPADPFFEPRQSFWVKIVNVAPQVTSNGILFALQVLLCIPSGLNHLSVCTKTVREKNTHYALLSVSEALFFAFRIVEVFMDTKNQINTSQRSLELIMLCAMMLFFLYESRFLVKTEENGFVSVSKYYAAGLATIALTIVAVVPYLVLSVFWLYDGGASVMNVLECCMVLFAASRILTLHD